MNVIMNIHLIFLAFLWQFVSCINVNSVPFIHQLCRNKIYPRTNINRFPVPDHLVHWSIGYPGYLPIFYESENIHGKPYADPDIGECIEFCD